MRSFSLFTSIILLLLLLSCSDETAEIKGGSFDIPVVTGFVPRNMLGEMTSPAVGIPNIKISHNDFAWIAYPNPTETILSVRIGNNQVGGGSSSISSDVKVWLVPAVAGFNYVQNETFTLEKNYFNSTYLSNNFPIAEATISENRGITLNLNGAPPGFYRLYLKVENELLWDNILIIE